MSKFKPEQSQERNLAFFEYIKNCQSEDDISFFYEKCIYGGGFDNPFGIFSTILEEKGIDVNCGYFLGDNPIELREDGKFYGKYEISTCEEDFSEGLFYFFEFEGHLSEEKDQNGLDFLEITKVEYSEKEESSQDW